MDLFPLPSGGAVAPVAYKLNCLTEKMTIPTYASKSWLTVRVIAQAAGAGSATVRVRRTQLRKRLS
jgi:hypothetical protein